MAYVYRHIRKDKNEVFYIGIGTDKYHSRARQVANRNKYWTNIANKGYEIEILLDEITYDEAVKKEKEFIALYGRKDLGEGTLVNMTEGGEGGNKRTPWNKGKKASEDTRKKMSESHNGCIQSEKVRKLLAERNKTRVWTDEMKLKVSKGNTGKIRSEEVKKRISDTLIERFKNNKNGKISEENIEQPYAN